MLDGSAQGGSGYGGNINMSVSNGSINVTGNALLTADGLGGSYAGEGTPTSALGGTGYGGSVYLSSYGPGSITLGGLSDITADGVGGDGQTGGAGYGGDAEIYGYGGTISLGSTTFVVADGIGGSATAGFGGNGGLGSGRPRQARSLQDVRDWNRRHNHRR